jgi:hypothetical protein
MASPDISVGAGNKQFQVTQNGSSVIEGAPYQFGEGDQFWVRVKGPTLSGYLDNPVEQAKDLLKTYGGLVDLDFDANWATYRDKATPAQSAIASIKSRVWIQESTSLIEYALSILEQVRLEAFVDRNQKMKLVALHFEDFEAAPSFMIRNWDVERETFRPQLDDRINFNRAQGVFDLEPVIGEEGRKTPIYRNQGAITQAGKPISKALVFPNLYKEADVVNQVTEMIRLASAYSEQISLNLTWRALLKDLGDFVGVNVQIGSVTFDDIPAMIRSIGYNPNGLKLEARLWSFQMCPFPGWAPAYAGVVGGYNATITQE